MESIAVLVDVVVVVVVAVEAWRFEPACLFVARQREGDVAEDGAEDLKLRCEDLQGMAGIWIWGGGDKGVESVGGST